MKPVFTSDTFISETEVKEAISIPKVYREPVDETEPQETILTKITMFESDSTTLTNRNTIPSMCGDSKVTTFDNCSECDYLVDDIEKLDRKIGLATDEIDALNTELSGIESDIQNMETALGDKANRSELNGKVDKVEGKGLSTKDFTAQYQETLDQLSWDALYHDSSSSNTEMLLNTWDDSDSYSVVPTSSKGIANGVASLDSTGKIPTSQIPFADYVVSQGTNGEWRYRKWNSGFVEAWCNHDFGNVACTISSAAYGGYRSDLKTVTVPSGIFTRPDGCNINKSNTNALFVRSYDFSNSTIACYFSSGVSATQAATVSVYMWGE